MTFKPPRERGLFLWTKKLELEGIGEGRFWRVKPNVKIAFIYRLFEFLL